MGNVVHKSPSSVVEQKDGDTIITESEWITKIKQMKIPKDLKKFKTLRMPNVFDGYGQRMSREELKVPDGRGFILNNLLRIEECSFFINQLENEIGFEDMSEKYPQEYRSNDRVLVISDALVTGLWGRICPHFKIEDVFRIRPICFGNEGNWRPTRLNECVKFMRYRPGKHFSPHMDGSFAYNIHLKGPWVPREDESSIYTLIIYLNDNFEGGETIFLDEKSGNVVTTIKPQAGSAVIFNHDVMHEGKPVLSGNKYLLRTEIMFRRIDTEIIPDKQEYRKNPSYLKALSLYMKSYEFELMGDTKNFTKHYLKAIELQKNAQRTVSDDTKEIFNMKIPLDIYITIFSYLKPSQLLRLMRVNKLWNDIIRDGRLWKSLYVQEWPMTKSLEEKINKEGNLEPNPITKDWFTCFWQKRRQDTTFSAIVFDFGSHSTKASFYKNSITKYISIQSKVAKVSGLYDLHIRRTQFERYYAGEAAEKQFPANIVKPIVKGKIVEFSLLLELISSLYHDLSTAPKSHPVIIADPPGSHRYTDEQKDLFYRNFFSVFYSPSVCFIDMSVLALYGCQLTSGMVVLAGEGMRAISCIVDGQVVAENSQFDSENISEMAKAAKKLLESLGSEVEAKLRGNIVLSGGKFLDANFIEKVKTEFYSVGNFKFVISDNPVLDVVSGGAAFAQLSLFEKEKKEKIKSVDSSDTRGSHFYMYVVSRGYYWFSGKFVELF